MYFCIIFTYLLFNNDYVDFNGISICMSSICLSKPVHRACSHWSDYAHLITPEARSLILAMPTKVDSVITPDCPVSSFIAGLLLGDGGIHKYGKSHRFDLQLHFSEKSLAFMALTCMFLEHVGLGNGNMHLYLRYTQGAFRWSIKCRSSTRVEWTEARQFWYPNNVKIVPTNIDQLFSELGIAALIMGDGGRTGGGKYSGTRIHTHSFTKKEVNILISAFKRVYGITFKAQKAHIKTNGKRAYFMASNVENSRRLRSLFANYMHQSWHYKMAQFSKNI